jgi:hypothetical protein
LRSAVNQLEGLPQAADGQTAALGARPTPDNGTPQIMDGGEGSSASNPAGTSAANHPKAQPQVASMGGSESSEPGKGNAPPHGPYPVGTGAIDFSGEGPVVKIEPPPVYNANRGQLAGPANNSRAGDSALGGLGTQALNGNGALSDLQIALGDQLNISDDEPAGKGRRIRLEAPPQTQLAAIAINRPSSSGNWLPATEGEVVRASVSMSRREIVRRYFLPEPEAATP